MFGIVWMDTDGAVQILHLRLLVPNIGEGQTLMRSLERGSRQQHGIHIGGNRTSDNVSPILFEGRMRQIDPDIDASQCCRSRS